MSDEDRIRDYLRGRADVKVPDDLRALPAAPGPGPRWRMSSMGRVAGLAAAALVVAVVVGVTSIQPPTTVGPGSSAATGGPDATLPSSGPVDARFPAEVAGMPVVTVAHARDLLRTGKLDGQAVAVAGYYSAFYPSCPYPGRYIGPLEGWCDFIAFADTASGAQLCHAEGANGTSCSKPAGTFSPFLVAETSGNPWPFTQGIGEGMPSPVVFIGHAGDPRQWQCLANTRTQCASAFVVDRVAWAAGHDLPVAAPDTGDQQSGTPITPRMTLEQVAAAAGLGENLLTGAAFRAGDLATVDPRWNRGGDNLLWLLRSIEPGSSQGADTRPEMVWLVDDATGTVLDSQPLQVDAAYQPAQLWPIATVRGQECCPGGGLTPFVRVVAADGSVAYDGIVSGGASGDQNGTTFGGGYGSLPIVVPAGNYTLSAWLANYPGGQGNPERGCSTAVTLAALDAVAYNAVYPTGEACAFQPAAAPSPAP